MQEMHVDTVLQELDRNREVTEAYVLLRELRLFLDVGHDCFHPELVVKIYKSTALEQHPYHFRVSHNVQTPQQAGPYYPSRTCFESEEEAIDQAISTTTSFITSAIEAGHEPSESWLIRNELF